MIAHSVIRIQYRENLPDQSRKGNLGHPRGEWRSNMKVYVTMVNVVTVL